MDNKFSADAMSQGMRTAAETTLAKAKEAVDQYMKEATRVFAAADTTAQATQAGARDMTQKAVSNAEANIAAAFDFAAQLVKAKDPQEFLKLQQAFVKQQAENLGAQMREMGSAVANVAAKAKGKS
ncbi:Phasin protein [Rhizobiales bacterium GAS191]|jgi:hypothetical protein|nr:Phasin protein [Rhizobiales bacterium GAS113]SED60769.1 Phasin protein [Rhizobiales bacterium GAS188]SEE87544.1 Phasin protein [Rhizobiales bacterium GAS191]